MSSVGFGGTFSNLRRSIQVSKLSSSHRRCTENSKPKPKKRQQKKKTVLAAPFRPSDNSKVDTPKPKIRGKNSTQTNKKKKSSTKKTNGLRLLGLS